MRNKQEHKFSELTFACSKLTLETRCRMCSKSTIKDVECVQSQQ